MPRLIATWNPARGVWETPARSLLCEHLAPFLEIWPDSGTTRDGSAFALPTSALLTSGRGSSSLPTLPTPDAAVFNDGQTVQAWADRKEKELAKGYNGNGGGTPLAMLVRLLPTPEAKLSDSGPDYARATRDGSGGDDLTTTVHKMMPTLKTPTASLGGKASPQHPDKRKAGGHGPTLADEVAHTLPTPQAADGSGGRWAVEGHQTSLPGAVRETLMPTPTARDWKDGACADADVPTNALLGRVAARLPTPRATRGGSTTEISYRMGGERSDENRPQGEVLMPTPTAMDSIGSRNSRADRRADSTGHPGDTLTDVADVLSGKRTRVADREPTMLPTPTAETNTKSTRALTASTDNGRRSGGGQSSPLGLEETASLLAGVRPEHLPADEELPPASRAVIASLLPTPTSQLRHDSQTHRSGNRTDELLLGGIALSIGASTRPPSPGGRPSPDGTLPLPLNPDETETLD